MDRKPEKVEAYRGWYIAEVFDADEVPMDFIFVYREDAEAVLQMLKKAAAVPGLSVEPVSGTVWEGLGDYDLDDETEVVPCVLDDITDTIESVVQGLQFFGNEVSKDRLNKEKAN